MSDSFGLEEALKSAKKGGIKVESWGRFSDFFRQLDTLHESEEEFTREFKLIERQINRGAQPDTKRLLELSKLCHESAKKLKAGHATLEREADKEAKGLRSAKNKEGLKLISDIEDILDKIGDLLMQQKRRPDAGEIVLSLIMRRGSGEKSAKAKSKIDEARPGSGLKKEVEIFYKRKPDVALAVLMRNSSYGSLDEAAKFYKISSGIITQYNKFLNDPTPDSRKQMERFRDALEKFGALMGETGKAVSDLKAAFKKSLSKIDDKEVTESLDGSLKLVAEHFEDMVKESRISSKADVEKAFAPEKKKVPLKPA